MITPRLDGRRVLLTRALEDSRVWAERLRVLGAETMILPCVHTEPLNDADTRARLATALSSADWLCVTSPRGAEAVAQLAGPLPVGLLVATVGDATAAAARRALGRATFVSSGGTSRALGEELLRDGLVSASGSPRIVVAGAEDGRTDADDVLSRGGAIVTRIIVYRTVPASPRVDRMDLADEGVEDIILASPSAVRGLLNQAVFPTTARIFTIGPTTSAAAVAAGFSPSGEASSPDLDSLVEAMQ